MKKTMIIALAVMAGALLNTADAKKKKESKKSAEVEEVKPLELTSSSDTLSYAAGMMLTDGLIPYLNQTGVDTAYMAKFIEGFETVANAGDNPELKAYVAGMEIANRMKDQMLAISIPATYAFSSGLSPALATVSNPSINFAIYAVSTPV